jgi:glycosyltransferase involved in cell wall biosynthesis
MLYFDSRWLKSGGIGRFCKEIMQAQSLNGCGLISGELSSALSAIDPIKLSRITLSGSYFVSPGYNCPFFSAGKAVVTLHDLMHLRFPEYSNAKNKLYYNYIVKQTVRNAPAVFTVSDFTRKEISAWANISINKITVVPNGVDHEFYHEAVLPIVRARPYFLYVGNNKSHKNLKRLVSAYASSGLSTEVDLLISCKPTPELSLLIAELDMTERVVFLCGVEESDLPSYYKGAVATVVVSLYEGFCLPILESMAVGTPVITSNVTAMPETAGGAAFLVDPYDINSIRDGLVDIWQQKLVRINLVELGLKRAQMFSWERSREIWDDALIPILEK